LRLQPFQGHQFRARLQFYCQQPSLPTLIKADCPAICVQLRETVCGVYVLSIMVGQVKNDCIGPELLTDLSTSDSDVVILSSLRDKVMVHVQGRRKEFVVFHNPLFVRLFYAKCYIVKN
jgi:hypothetical protein